MRRRFGFLAGIIALVGVIRLFGYRPGFWMIFLGACAAVTLLMPSLPIVAMITIIGIPIGLFLMASPFMFLVYAGSSLVSRMIGGGWPARIVGVLVTLAVLAVPSHFANRMLERRMVALTAQDKDDGGRPAARVIAVRYDRPLWFSRDELHCDGFCLRALMNGVADKVLYATQDLNLHIEPSMKAESFRLDRRDVCPPVKLRSGGDTIAVPNEGRDWKSKRAEELMQLEIAKGNCLIAESASLSEADIILSRGEVHRGTSKIDAGLDPFADTVRADRIMLHEKRGGHYIETYRWTGVIAEKMAPFYAPTVEGGQELRAWPALVRFQDRRNIREKYYQNPDWSGFLVERLGYDLALRLGNADTDMRKVLSVALTRPKAAPINAVGADYLHGIMRNGKMGPEDIQLAQALLADVHFKVPLHASSAVIHAEGASPDYFSAISTSMFARLRTIAAGDVGEDYPPWKEEVSNIANVIRYLPPETVLRHRDDLEWLARQERLREPAYVGLNRLSEFGASALPTLLWLIDDAQRFAKNKGNAWQHPILNGMIGICQVGAKAAASKQEIYDRLDAGYIPTWGSYGRLAVHTLVAMGAAPEEMWPHLRPAKAEDREKARSRFDMEVKRALKKTECYY
jgi:hypothetical protein